MPLLLMRRPGDACILQSRREGRFEAFQACHALLETEVRVLQSPSSPGGGRVSSPKRDVGLWSWSLFTGGRRSRARERRRRVGREALSHIQIPEGAICPLWAAPRPPSGVCARASERVT